MRKTSFWRPDIEIGQTPYKVKIIRDEVADEQRGGRMVPFKLYYPADYAGDAGLPVVFWSHGLGGSRDGAAFIGRFLAGYGYIVVNIQHPGTDISLWEGKPGHPWDVIRATPISKEASLERFRDVPFILDTLPGHLKHSEDIAGKMDWRTVGISGHSFGALTTQVMAGQALGHGERAYRMHEPRFKAGIAYSPTPARNHETGDHEKIYGAIDIPLLFMTGTQDSSPLSGLDYTHRLPIFEHAGGPERHLVVLEDADHMIFAGSRGKLAANPKREPQENMIKLITLAFWDAYLRDDDAARVWLTGKADEWLGREGTYRFSS